MLIRLFSNSQKVAYDLLKMFIVRTLKDLLPVLWEQPKNLQAEAYYVIRDADLLHGPEPNITIIPPHKIGREFPKTFGHYHNQGEPETYRILYGQCGLLMQKPLFDISNNPDYSKIVEVKLLRGQVGDTMEVPTGFGHCLINLGNDLLVTADWESQSAGHIYEPIQKLHGFCYYIVEENGELKAIKNPNYSEIPDINF